MNTFIYLAGNLLRIFAVSQFIKCFFDKLNVKKTILFIAYFMFFTVNSSCFLLLNLPVINLISNMAFIFAVTLLYSSKLSKKVLCVLFVYLMCAATDVTADKLRILLDLPVSARGTFGVVVSDMLMLIIVNIAAKKNYIKNEYHIGLENKITLIFIPTASIIVEYYISAPDNTHSAAAASILMIFINLLVFYIFDNIAGISFKLWESRNFELLSKAYEKQLEIIKNNDKKTAVLKHDFKNQLAKLYELIEDDNIKAREHLENISEYIKAKGNYSDTGNKNIDSFLNYKFAEFETINCKIDCEMMIPADMELNPFEMTALLGNLLDNALRALKNVEEPYLYFGMAYSKNVIRILIKNPYNGNLIQRDDEFITTKKDKENHGIGMRIIKNIVKKYDGEIKVTAENNIFTVNLCFFLKTK